MLKLMGLLRRREGMSHDEFVAYWQSHHAEIARQLPGLRAYKLSPIDHHFEGGGPRYDGYGELWFDDRAAFDRATESAAWQAARADVPNFKAQGPLFLCEREIVVPPAG